MKVIGSPYQFPAPGVILICGQYIIIRIPCLLRMYVVLVRSSPLHRRIVTLANQSTQHLNRLLHSYFHRPRIVTLANQSTQHLNRLLHSYFHRPTDPRNYYTMAQ
jgi:hypothetical protein